jgi:hypothetical protein
MYINISLLEKYFEKNKMIINTNIDIDSNDAYLKFVRGEHRDGSRVEFLQFKELTEILEVNNILGDNGLLIQERDAFSQDLKNGLGTRNKREEKMEGLVYDTLAKYIIQMFYAGTEQIIFPSLIPLERHKELYFKTS